MSCEISCSRPSVKCGSCRYAPCQCVCVRVLLLRLGSLTALTALLQKELRSFTSGAAPAAAAGAPQVAHANTASGGDGSGVAGSVARLQTAHDDGLYVCFTMEQIACSHGI
jgi:hypothetical protein